MSYFSDWKWLSQPVKFLVGYSFRPWTLAAGGLIIASSVVWIGAYRYSPSLRSLIIKPQNGEIIVSSPTVYTRQRLVNDRLKQIAWLEDQIKAADGVSMGAANTPEFRMIDQVAGSTSTLSVTAQVATSGASGDKPSEVPSKPNAVRDDVAVAPTTSALFHAKNSFRDDVRAEMMETQLDDRHDILGNTIYRLSFQASVLAGTQTDAVAGIAVRISHCPNRSRILSSGASETCSQTSAERSATTDVLYRSDYNRLYYDWLRDLQKLVSSSIDNITEQFSVDQPDPTLRLLFSRFITGRLCEKYVVGVYAGSRIDEQCSPENLSVETPVEEAQKIQSNAGIARWVTESYIREYLGRLAERQDQYFVDSLARAKAKYPIIKSELETDESFQSRVRDSPRCRGATARSIPLKDLVQKEGNGSATGLEFPAGTDLPCPFVDSAIQHLQAGISLYKQVLQLPVPQHSSAADSILSTLAGNMDLNPFTLPDARCFAADFMKAKLNSFERPALAYEQIDKFMRLLVTGKEIGDCQLVVLPKQNAPIDELEYYLNRDTQLFSYTVTPKNLSENISTTADVRDAYQMLAQHQLGANREGAGILAKALKEKSEELRAVLEHPLVVGFGSGRQPLQFVQGLDGHDKSPTVRSTELGWIVAPHVRPGGRLVQIDGQYALTAVISVPSWWRTVEIDIETCWMPRDELEHYSKSTKILFCNEGKPTWTVVQLPGAIQELSRKLGFEVVQEPYITKPTLQQLAVGEPGHLIFTGGRLWRSTTVTLGSQMATSITVLPNMYGIVAYFDCVKPQPSSPGLRTSINTGTVPARVWTSEGVTDSIPVELIGAASCPAPTKVQESKN